jgi:hypothetical protein
VVLFGVFESIDDVLEAATSSPVLLGREIDNPMIVGLAKIGATQADLSASAARRVVVEHIGVAVFEGRDRDNEGLER